MLNPEQQAAVETIDGPLLIIAGAGTGKTFTIIERIKNIVAKKKAWPAQVLVLTFTNKAAQEIKNRLQKDNLFGVQAYTFHALAAKLLREFWKPEFRIIDEKEKKEILKNILREEEWKKVEEVEKEMEEVRHHGSTAPLCNVFSRIANKSCFREDYGASNVKGILNEEDDKRVEEVQTEMEKRKNKRTCAQAHMRTKEGENVLTEKRIREVIKQFEDILNEKQALDFTGLISKLLRIWEENPEIKKKCQKKYKYVMVDEYQDVSDNQIAIMKGLIGEQKNIGVVGDPDQTIYSWRYANPLAMQNFLTLYPEARTLILQENYRNPAKILAGAENLIKNNNNRFPKELKARKTEGQTIQYFEAGSEEEKMEIIIHLLESYLGSHTAMHLADQLDSELIGDYRNFSEIAFLYRTRNEGKMLAQFLTRRGYPLQISAGENFWERKEIEDFINNLQTIKNNEEAFALKTKEQINFYDWFNGQLNSYLEQNKLSPNKKDNLLYLLLYACQFNDLSVSDGLSSFLDLVKTNQEADNIITADKINLLTLHAAKGLEFPIVIILGLEEDHFPNKKVQNDLLLLEEERRLFYVGMTRASEVLHLIYTKNHNDKVWQRSLFISEIGLDNLEIRELEAARKKKIAKIKAKKAQISLF